MKGMSLVFPILAAATAAAASNTSSARGYRWDCGPLVHGELCGGSYRTCPAATLGACVQCCEAQDTSGCCVWLGNETSAAYPTATLVGNASNVTTATMTQLTATLTNTSAAPDGDVVDPGLCRFHPGDGASTYGGAPEGWSRQCVRVTETPTETASLSATASLTAVEGADSCGEGRRGFHPARVSVGANFTLRVDCRRGVAGEALFLTRTTSPAECRREDAVLLGYDGDSDVVDATGADAEGHPTFAVPALLEAGEYQVCLIDLAGAVTPLHAGGGGGGAGARGLRALAPAALPYVRVDDGGGGGAAPGRAFRLRVEGYGLGGGFFALAESSGCDTSHLVWESGGSGGSLVAAEDGTSAEAVVSLDRTGRHWSCFKPHADAEYEAHASFVVRSATLTHASTTPAILHARTPFVLALFGRGLSNDTRWDGANATAASRCRVLPSGLAHPWGDGSADADASRCETEGVESAAAFLVDGGLTCVFPNGVAHEGWYRACVGGLNATGAEDVVDGGFFRVRPLPVVSARPLPSSPETRAFLTVVLEGPPHGGNAAGLLDGLRVRLVDTVAGCTGGGDGNATLLGASASNEVRARLWTGPRVLALPSSTAACVAPGGNAAGTAAGPFDLPAASDGYGPRNAAFSCALSHTVPGDTGLLVVCADNATAATVSAVYTRTEEDCLAVAGGRSHYHPGSNRCDVPLCPAQHDLSRCPGPRCGLASGRILMGIGHCVLDAAFVARAWVEATASVCGDLRGRYERGRCQVDVCDAAALGPALERWHEGSADYSPVFVSEPLVVNHPAFPVSVCFRNKYEDAWRWAGGFGVRDSCRVRRAKLCRWSSCGGHLSPGPCRVSGVESAAALERTGYADYQSYAAGAGPKSAQTGVLWGSGQGVLHGASNHLQVVCAALACEASEGARGRPSARDHVPVRFASDAPLRRHPAFALSPDRLEARLMSSRTAFPVEAGDEVQVLTGLLPLSEQAELSFAFSFRGVLPSALRVGLLGNDSTAFDDAATGAFYNSTASPLSFGATLNSTESSCALAAGLWYRVVASLKPPEIAVWPDTEGQAIHSYPLCFLHRRTSFELFVDVGWRFAFVLQPSADYEIPRTNQGSIRLRP